MRIVLLGASGQVGSVLYNALRHYTPDVVRTSRRRLAGLVQFDPLRDDWAVLGGADVLINCVGQIDARAARSFDRVHTELTERILRHRERIGNPFVIQVSALGALAHHKTDFLRTKGIADDLLLGQPDTAVVRPSIVCTHRTMLLRKILMLENWSRFTGGIIPVPDGFLRTRLQPVMPQDLADLIYTLCQTRLNGLFNIAGAEVFTFGDLIRMMEKARNRRLTFIEFPRVIADLVIGQFVSNLWPMVLGYQQYQLLFEDNVADTSQVEEILGRRMMSTRAFFEMQLSHANN